MTDNRDVTSVLSLMTLRYVRRALGEGAVADVLAAAGVAADDPGLESDRGWVSLRTAVAIADASAAACGDLEIGRRTGEEYFEQHLEQGVTAFLLAEGTPADALQVAVAFASRMSTARQFHAASIDETTVVVEAHSSADPPNRYFCGTSVGYWSRIPTLFGARGTAVERKCQSAGDEVCEFVVRWDRPVKLDEDVNEENRAWAENTVRRFEAYEEMAAELLLAEDVQTVMQLVAKRGGEAIMAPQVVVTIQESDGDALLVASVGLDDDEAEAASEALWAGRAPTSLGGNLIVEIASPHRHYGYLAAIFPPDTDAILADERLLRAYAGSATAAIERAISRDEAARSHQTAAALLALARSLSTTTTIQDVCREVALAVPSVTSCDLGGVWLWEPAHQTFRLEARSAGWRAAGVSEVRVDELARIGELTDGPRTLVVSIDSSDATTAEMLSDWGVREGFVAPIVLRGELLGLVTAASTNPVDGAPARDRVSERVSALADQATTALDSSILLDQIRHQALHDGLTGLPNRALVAARTKDAIEVAAATGDRVAALFVDLDRFKNVNDTLGHGAGDELICQVANRLLSCVRSTDTVARLGGDEFFVLLPRVRSVEDASPVADAIIDAIRQPFTVGDSTFYISSSVGIACSPDHGTDFATLMSHADTAMYRAKAFGRSTYAVHAGDEDGERRHRLELESALHVAVERDELAVVYQPQFDLATGTLVGVEALVRWDHPTLGRLGPDAFLGIAEESGVIVDIDAWVRRAALRQAKAWSDRGTPVRMAFNLSTRDLRNPELVDLLQGLLTESQVAPDLVELEITDRVIMSSEDLPGVMWNLRTLGTRLALDDFGTGNSVLSRLQHCPLDVLKIDRSFVSELTGDDADARLVHALISMAHALGLTVVGEGIETEAQRRILERYGCDIGQGFLLSRPVDAEDIELLMSADNGVSMLVPGR